MSLERAMGHVRGQDWAPSEVQVANMSGIKSPKTQISFWGPGSHLGGILQPLEAEGRLIEGWGAEPPGISLVFPYFGPLMAQGQIGRNGSKAPRTPTFKLQWAQIGNGT